MPLQSCNCEENQVVLLFDASNNSMSNRFEEKAPLAMSARGSRGNFFLHCSLLDENWDCQLFDLLHSHYELLSEKIQNAYIVWSSDLFLFKYFSTYVIQIKTKHSVVSDFNKSVVHRNSSYSCCHVCFAKLHTLLTLSITLPESILIDRLISFLQ